MTAEPLGVALRIPHDSRYVHGPRFRQRDALGFKRAQEHRQNRAVERRAKILGREDVVLAMTRSDANGLEASAPDHGFHIFTEPLVAALPVHDARAFFWRARR